LSAGLEKRLSFDFYETNPEFKGRNASYGSGMRKNHLEFEKKHPHM
jgi:hypothetical protein